MKTFFTLATAYVLGHIAAVSLIGCSADPTNVPIPKVEKSQQSNVPAEKSDEKKAAFQVINGGQARV